MYWNSARVIPFPLSEISNCRWIAASGQITLTSVAYASQQLATNSMIAVLGSFMMDPA